MRNVFSVLAALALPLPALATTEYYNDIDAAARITERNETRFERDSVTRVGEMIRFDVKVGWKTPSERPENEAPLRIVRYLVRCDEKEIAVSGVAVFDSSLRIVKSHGVPPGGWDFHRADPASLQRQWLEKVCDMPV